jgi:hypothetical protein
MAGRLEMPNGRAGHGSRQRFLEEHPGGQDAGLVEKSRDSRRAQYAAGGGLVALGAPRMRSVGPAIAAGREYAREAGDSASFRRLDRAAGLRRQFLTGTTPFTPKIVQRRPGLSALAGLALISHARGQRGRQSGF